MNDDSRNNSTEGKSGIPAWMVTFSDLATLLLTFFVLLLSMSSMDDRSMKSMFTNFTSACGILYFKDYGEIYKPKEILIEGLYEKLQDALVVKRSGEPGKDLVSESNDAFEERFGSTLVIEHFNNGFKLVFGHQLMFSPGSAQITEEMKPILNKVAKFMRASAYQIYIDGHTDNIPIHSVTHGNNEGLSLARAYNLLDYLVRNEKISSRSIAIAGYGEFLPVASNDTPTGREKNRRVEIIFKNKKYF